MGQRANNGGRNASLDDQKERAAGRQKHGGMGQGPDRDFDKPTGRGKTKGAFGNTLSARGTK